jgi:glycosyltransferase involved in cell wall biosynthesis
MASLDIILPAYNPLAGWEANVIRRFQSLQEALPELKLNLTIVNDGSQHLDASASLSILREDLPEIRWISYPLNRGKGYALRQGVAESTADYIVYTDIDWPYTEDSMTGLILALMQDHDAVIGIRDQGYYAQLPPARRRISRILRRINAGFLKLKVDDTQAGLKGFRQEVRHVFLSTTIDRYLFDLEFIYLLSGMKDIRITGFPITLRPGISFSKMNRKILFQEARNFFRIWRG